jgi:hypothetical protein
LIPIFIFFFYSTINISHTLFIHDQRKHLIKDSFKITFHKLKIYYQFIIFNIAITLIYLIIYNILHFIFKFLVTKNQQILINYGSAYLKIFQISSIIFIYLLISFNRIYFYGRINKNVLP